MGVPPSFYEMCIEDPERNQVPAGQIGEIIRRDPVKMTQHYKRPDRTQEAIKDGWLYTGGLGYVDELQRNIAGKVLKRTMRDQFTPESKFE